MSDLRKLCLDPRCVLPSDHIGPCDDHKEVQYLVTLRLQGDVDEAAIAEVLKTQIDFSMKDGNDGGPVEEIDGELVSVKLVKEPCAGTP